MAYLSQVTIGENTYDLKDSEARSAIAALEAYSDYLGVTTTALTDGASTNPITIGGESVTAEKGNIANYGSKEFIFNGTIWQEFGDMSAIGALGYVDEAVGSYTPAGSVSGTAVSFSPTTQTIDELDSVGTLPTMSVSGEILTLAPGTLPSKKQTTSAITALGEASVTDPTFSGTAATITVAPASGS